MTLSLSAPVEFLDAMLSSEKTQVTFQPPRKFIIGSIVGLYVDQRSKLLDKPLRGLTEIGHTEMIRMSQIGKKNYPPVTSDQYYAHFLGRVEIRDVFNIPPSDRSEQYQHSWAVAEGFVDFADADKWFTHRYGRRWKKHPCTVVRWKYLERYFYPGLVIG